MRMVFSDGKSIAYVTEKHGWYEVKCVSSKAKRHRTRCEIYSVHPNLARAIRSMHFRNNEWKLIGERR